jgi:hypothetical protein
MYNVLLPPGVNPIAVKYIYIHISYHNLNFIHPVMKITIMWKTVKHNYTLSIIDQHYALINQCIVLVYYTQSNNARYEY